ncbi:hypothetical protein NIES2101_31920 [Calothrix sp. HK-06]|nr:hypothetical protein NIES2101_31920 [Calothrix sp. HK-06]
MIPQELPEYDGQLLEQLQHDLLQAKIEQLYTCLKYKDDTRYKQILASIEDTPENCRTVRFTLIKMIAREQGLNPMDMAQMYLEIAQKSNNDANETME